MTVREIVVSCSACAERLARPFPLTRFELNEHGAWVLDDLATHGHGRIDDGLADWYVDGLGKRRAEVAQFDEVSRDGVIVSETYTLTCPKCRDRVQIGVAKMREACRRLAEAGRTGVSLGDLRHAARTLG